MARRRLRQGFGLMGGDGLWREGPSVSFSRQAPGVPWVCRRLQMHPKLGLRPGHVERAGPADRGRLGSRGRAGRQRCCPALPWAQRWPLSCGLWRAPYGPSYGARLAVGNGASLTATHHLLCHVRGTQGALVAAVLCGRVHQGRTGGGCHCGHCFTGAHGALTLCFHCQGRTSGGCDRELSFSRAQGALVLLGHCQGRAGGG